MKHRCYFSGGVQGCHGQEKYLQNEIFSRSGNFMDGQGNLERPWKVREKSGNLKINGCGKQTSEKFILFKREKRCTFS